MAEDMRGKLKQVSEEKSIVVKVGNDGKVNVKYNGEFVITEAILLLREGMKIISNTKVS